MAGGLFALRYVRGPVSAGSSPTAAVGPGAAGAPGSGSPQQADEPFGSFVGGLATPPPAGCSPDAGPFAALRCRLQELAPQGEQGDLGAQLEGTLTDALGEDPRQAALELAGSEAAPTEGEPPQEEAGGAAGLDENPDGAAATPADGGRAGAQARDPSAPDDDPEADAAAGEPTGGEAEPRGSTQDAPPPAEPRDPERAAEGQQDSAVSAGAGQSASAGGEPGGAESTTIEAKGPGLPAGLPPELAAATGEKPPPEPAPRPSTLVTLLWLLGGFLLGLGGGALGVRLADP